MKVPRNFLCSNLGPSKEEHFVGDVHRLRKGDVEHKLVISSPLKASKASFLRTHNHKKRSCFVTPHF